MKITFIDGIGATEDLDSSGERIIIKGLDVSSLEKDGIFNFEHRSDAPADIVGKILYVNKIFDKSDCKNKREEYFFEKNNKKPYLYVAGILFDVLGHKQAKHVASMMKVSSALKDTSGVLGFSVEGSRLEVKDNIVKEAILRKITLTVSPCNKSCVAEVLEEPSKEVMDKIDEKKMEDIIKSCEEDMGEEVKKSEKDQLISLVKADNKPKNKFLSATMVPTQTMSQKYDEQQKGALQSKPNNSIKNDEGGFNTPTEKKPLITNQPIDPASQKKKDTFNPNPNPTKTIQDKMIGEKEKLPIGTKIEHNHPLGVSGEDIWGKVKNIKSKPLMAKNQLKDFLIEKYPSLNINEINFLMEKMEK